jgi:hypothetical protein
MIAFVTSSSYTHAGIVYDVTDTEVITAEAQANGFILIHRSKEEFYALADLRSITLLRSRKPLFDMTESIELMLGTKYGYLDLLKILINKITGKKAFRESTNSIICSEAVARLLYSASDCKVDLSKEFNKGFDLITPDDLNMSKFLKSAN